MSDRWPTRLSIAALIENQGWSSTKGYYGGGILLVTKRDSGLLGLPAGGIGPQETGTEGVLREIFEETGLKPETVKVDNRPIVRLVPREDKTSVGLLYEGHTTIAIPQDGIVQNSDEISLVRPYTIDEIFELVEYSERLFKPEFNLYFLEYAIYSFLTLKYAYENWDPADFREWKLFDPRMPV